MHIVRSTAVDPEQVGSAQSTAWLVFAIILNIAIAMYLLPTLIALIRHVHNLGTIVVINIFLGWSFYGWVAALALACQHVDKPPRPHHRQAAWELVHWPQPGWYPDPSPVDTPVAQLRFFDGSDWTGHTVRRG
jgi:hypothetical protein